MGYNKAYESFWDLKCQSQALSENIRSGHMETGDGSYKATEQHFLFLHIFPRINYYWFDEFFGKKTQQR